MSTIPIPQGATIGDSQAVAIPADAKVGYSPQADNSGFFANLGSDLASSLKGMAHLFDAPQGKVEEALGSQPGALQLYRAAKGYYQATQESVERARQAGERGDKAGVVFNAAAAGLPLVGPLVGGVYEAAQSKSPAGAAGVGASRILQAASMAPEGSAIPNPVNAVGPVIRGAQKAAGTLAPNLYRSALKPSVVAADPAGMVRTGIENRISVTPEGLEKLGLLVDDLNTKIADVIQSRPNASVNKFAVASRLSDTARDFANQVNPVKDLNDVAKSGNEFLGTQPGTIPAADAQSLKVGTYRQLKGKYGEMGAAQIESQKALARGLKEELANEFPELQGLNAKEGALLDLQPALERAVNRIANHQLIGIGTPIAAGATKAVTGSAGAAAVAGTIKAIIDMPEVKSKLAFALSKASKGSVPYPAAMGRVSAYVNALAATAAASQAPGAQNGE